MARGKTDQRNAAEFERRTGQTTNMLQLGWKLVSRTSKGEPNRYKKTDPTSRFEWHIVRGVKGWRAEQQEGGAGQRAKGYYWPKPRKIITPSVGGPISLACWLAVEISNETVRYDT